MCAWHLLLRRGQLALPLMRDEGEYACVARSWARGALPYRDAFSQKPPMIFFLYRLAYGIRPADPLAPRLLMVAASLLILGLLLAMAPESWPWAARLCAPAAFAVSSAWPIGSLGFAANTEIFLCAFTAFAALALLKSWTGRRRLAWAAVCGLACGAAVMTKQTALPTAAGFGLLLWLDRRGGGLAYAAGLCAIPALFLLYFHAKGGLPDFWQAVYARNMDYARLVLSTGTARSQADWFLKAVVPLFARAGWPVFALAGFGLWGRPAAPRSLEVLAVVWIGTAAAGALTGLLLFPYYFLQAFPALALLAAMGAERLAAWRRAAAACALAALCACPALADFGLYFRQDGPALAKSLLYPNPVYEAEQVGLFLRDRTQPSDVLYVFGSEAQIYIYAQRPAATPHIMAYPLTMFPRDQAFDDAELAAVERARPRFVVFSTQKGSTLLASAAGFFFERAIQGWLAEDYRWVALSRIDPIRSSFVTGKDLGRPDWSIAPALLVFERK